MDYTDQVDCGANDFSGCAVMRADNAIMAREAQASATAWFLKERNAFYGEPPLADEAPKIWAGGPIYSAGTSPKPAPAHTAQMAMLQKITELELRNHRLDEENKSWLHQLNDKSDQFKKLSAVCTSLFAEINGLKIEKAKLEAELADIKANGVQLNSVPFHTRGKGVDISRAINNTNFGNSRTGLPLHDRY